MNGVKAIARTASCFLCLSIVPAFQPRLAAAVAVSEDVPVPGGVASFAASLGVEPSPDRGRFVYEMTRLVYEAAGVRNLSTAAFLQGLRQGASRTRRTPIAAPPSSADVVPVPLTSEIWGDAVFHRRVAPADLLAAIISDRQAALLCHGLASLDDRTLEYFAAHSSLIARLYERSAPAFAAFASGLRLVDSRVVPPGDAGAVALWEAVVNEKVTRPDRFVAALFELFEGRLAYMYDTIAQLDPSRRAFTLGAWMPQAARLERFKALTTGGLAAMGEWHIQILPFARQPYDLAMGLTRLEVHSDGAPAEPASRAFWSRVFGGSALEDGQIDAAWLASVLGPFDLRHRAERLDQIAFAQRVLAGDQGSRSDVVFVIRSLPRFRALLLTLERMGVQQPEIYAAAVRHASRLSPLDGRRGFIAQAQLQGALAILARLTRVGTLDAASGERLLGTLVAVSLTEDGRYAGAIAHWLEFDLRPALPAARDAESAMVAGLAGPLADPETLRRISWEGQQYRLDLAAAERRRLQRAREKQEGPSLDVPLQLAAASRLLATDQIPLDDLKDLMLQLTTLASDVPERPKEQEAENSPPGVPVPPSLREMLHKSIDELGRAIKGKDSKRALRLSQSLAAFEDETLARVLMSFAYAIDLGDPDGTVLLAGDMSPRHDFGFGLKDGDTRVRSAWAIPRQEVAPGVPWHVRGSVLGLDVALSSLSLRRVSTDHALEAPRLTSNARETFAASVSLLDPIALRDADRDAIALAIERGRVRVLSLADAAAVDELADELSLDGARRRTLRWTRAHEPERLPSMLSMTELLTLGGGRTSDLHAWGMAAMATSGCLCSRLLPPGRWPTLAGRPSLGLAATVLPDLNLHVAIMLKQLGLPSPLAKVVLSAAMQDFIDEVKPTDEGDWVTLSRAARALTRERIEDYVAAATAAGPLVPDTVHAPEQ